MNKNMISFFLCPLPEEQKPLQMYLSLKEGWFVGWTTFSTPSYQKRLVQISLLLFFVTSLFNFPFFQESAYWIERFLVNICWSLSLLLFGVMICYFRWKELEKKFLDTTLPYEEGSWYNAQMWEKPFLIQQKDKDISQKKIRPILQRLLGTSYLVTCFLLITVLFLQFQ